MPTVAESGFSGFDVNPWFGILAPAGTPAATVKKINTDVNQMLAQKDVIDRFLGEEKPLRFVDVEKAGFFKRLFGGK